MITRKINLLTLLSITLLFSGCSLTSSVKTKAPSAARVAELSSRRDPNLPIYLLYVEPISFTKFKSDSWCQPYSGPESLMNSALINSLVSSGNFAVVELTTLRNSSVRPRAEEKGPFIIRVTPSEFTKTSEKKERGISTKIEKDDSTLEVIGKGIASIPGFWITQITGLPTSWSDKQSKGVVALDIAVIDAKTKQIVTSFPARGSFSTQQREIGNGIQGYYSSENVSSPVESAVRAAMNDAAGKLLENLSRKYPKSN